MLISTWTPSKQRLESRRPWNRAESSPQSSYLEPASNIQSQMTWQNWKTISKPAYHADSREPADGSLTLPQRKGMRQRNKPPINQHSKIPTLNQDGWWPTELIFRNWEQPTPHWGRSSLSSCHWKTGKNKLANLPNHLARLRQSFCLNTNTKTGCWRSNTRTTNTEILLFLNLECFYAFVCLFSSLFGCPEPLSVDFFGFLFCCCLFPFFFVLLVLLLWVS
jgi:hypothetical protein